MNVAEVSLAIPVLLKHKVVPFLWGQQGVGKTQVVKQIAHDNNLGFVHLHLATQEVGDLVGLLIHGQNGEVKHARPEWFPTEGRGIIFLDELNRCHPDVMQAMFSFITEGTIHTHRLPVGWSIVAAGNFQSNSFNVTDTSDAAWMSRFCHIDFHPTIEEFIDFAEIKGSDLVADFIRDHREMLEVSQKERLSSSMITPDRRSWVDMISRLETDASIDNVRYELYAGIVGPTAASSYLSWKKKSYERLRGKDILFRYYTVRNKVLDASKKESCRFDLLDTAVEEIFTVISKMELKENELSNLMQFILDVPTEMSLKISKKLSESDWPQKLLIMNDRNFVRNFKERKLQQ